MSDLNPDIDPELPLTLVLSLDKYIASILYMTVISAMSAMDGESQFLVDKGFDPEAIKAHAFLTREALNIISRQVADQFPFVISADDQTEARLKELKEMPDVT